jgi:RNA polymerase sigma factor (sigma-70 family)
VSLAQSSAHTGSGRVLTVLYKEHAADAFRYALHLTGRRADAEDIVQQVFLDAHRHLDAGRELVSPRAWLLTAVKHRAYTLARDRREVPVDQPVPPMQSRDASRDEAAELAAVRGMLWTLPEAQHHAFVLRHWSGLSQREIADVLDTTPSAVESLLVRARSALVRSHESASEACGHVRTRLLESAALGTSDEAHLDGCRPCRQARVRLAHAGNLAATLALVPGSHVTDAIAGLVPGFSAHAATSTAAAAGTTGAGAGAGGAGGASASWAATTAATTAGKVALVAKTAVAVAAATAAVGSVPAAHHALSALIAKQVPGWGSAADRHAARRESSSLPDPVATPGDQAPTETPATGDIGQSPAESAGEHGGAGMGLGKPEDAGTGKPADPGVDEANGNGLGAGGNGNATGTPTDAGEGSGKAGGKPYGTGGGKPDDTGGGKPDDTGGGKPDDTGGGKPDDTGGGKPDDTGGGKPDGTGGGNGGSGTVAGAGSGTTADADSGNANAGGNGNGSGGKPAGAGGGKPT